MGFFKNIGTEAFEMLPNKVITNSKLSVGELGYLKVSGKKKYFIVKSAHELAPTEIVTRCYRCAMFDKNTDHPICSKYVYCASTHRPDETFVYFKEVNKEQ